MWNALNCLDWILCSKGNRPVHCEADASAGFFLAWIVSATILQMELQNPVVNDWLFGYGDLQQTTSRWLTSPCRRSSTAFNSYSFMNFSTSLKKSSNLVSSSWVRFLISNTTFVSWLSIAASIRLRTFWTHWIEELYCHLSDICTFHSILRDELCL